MARPPRPLLPDGLYHVSARGNERATIYRDAGDRRLFLELLAKGVERYHWRILSYCLMTNHYHLLVQTPLANLSRGMRQLNGVYAQSFNRRHNRVGHLFQGRYQARVVQADAHLLSAMRYIVRTPSALASVTLRTSGAGRVSPERGALAAAQSHGYGVREIARHLGIDPATVSRRLRRERAVATLET